MVGPRVPRRLRQAISVVLDDVHLHALWSAVVLNVAIVTTSLGRSRVEVCVHSWMSLCGVHLELNVPAQQIERGLSVHTARTSHCPPVVIPFHVTVRSHVTFHRAVQLRGHNDAREGIHLPHFDEDATKLTTILFQECEPHGCDTARIFNPRGEHTCLATRRNERTKTTFVRKRRSSSKPTEALETNIFKIVDIQINQKRNVICNDATCQPNSLSKSDYTQGIHFFILFHLDSALSQAPEHKFNLSGLFPSQRNDPYVKLGDTKKLPSMIQSEISCRGSNASHVAKTAQHEAYSLVDICVPASMATINDIEIGHKYHDF